MRLDRLVPFLVLVLASAPTAAAQTYFGPVPYLSAADVPAGLYAGVPTIEDFEDGTLSFGFTGTGGNVLGPTGFTDSVDGDDGVIDGSGTAGRSWFGSGPQTFTFPSPVTAAGIVWTDGGPTQVRFEAFGPGMVSLGVHGPFPVGDPVFTGTTAEDRFFGVQHQGGIVAIVLNSNTTIELDHVQTGDAPFALCLTEPNSTGVPARMGVSGSFSLAANDLVLSCTQLPADVWTMFVVSRDLGTLPNPGGSQGNLCLGGAIGRFNRPADLRNSGAAGMVSLALDSAALPTPNAFVPAAAGETWHFSAWYRDVAPGGVPSSNLANVANVTFGS